MREERDVKTRTQIIVVAAVLIGLAGLSSITKRGGRGETGKCSGGACCPLVPGLNTWPTGLPAGTNFAETNLAVTASGTITNGQR